MSNGFTPGADGAKWRAPARIVEGQPASDGGGVRLTRIIGTRVLPDLDPFLMLDEFRSDSAEDYVAGFPDHPHRGFETVTYMLAGRMRHRDNRGNSGLLVAGGAQWMTAGRGIVHSEMPEQDDGLMWGFQLWINLPAKDKLGPPRYQDVAPAAIPEVALPDGGTVRVLAGALGDARGPMEAASTDPTYLDVRLAARGSFARAVPAGYAAFAYVYEGVAALRGAATGAAISRGQLAVLGDGEHVGIDAVGGPARVLLLAGRPLREPIAKYGPFVMNTQAEIRQAVADFQAGRF